MKKKDQAPQQTLVERQPLTGSRKIYVPGKLYPNMRVAMREIALADTRDGVRHQWPLHRPGR
jgi:phosphomethylpyrimidine synthase